jgi:hypothetical protein
LILPNKIEAQLHFHHISVEELRINLATIEVKIRNIIRIVAQGILEILMKCPPFYEPFPKGRDNSINHKIRVNEDSPAIS